MASTHCIRFGIQLSHSPDGPSWSALARQAEDLGYSTLFVPDHFEDQFGPLVALTSAAAATSTLRVGALVLDNDYRHPVPLAKELASLDLVSEGRLEVGIGAGWMRTDYDKAGMTYDIPKVRVDRMAEAITVLKGCFSDGPFSFSGEHYTIDNYDNRPAPVQRPHPPFLLGGGGKRMLGIAAREGDIVGINPSLHAGEVGPDAAADATAEATDRKLGWVRDAAGDRFDEIELNCLVLATMVTDDQAGMAAMMGQMFGLDAERALEVPHALIGTVDQIVEQIEARRDRWGFTYWVVQGDAMESFAPVVARLAGT
jgi:probable F420-dependent oxidoreductase